MKIILSMRGEEFGVDKVKKMMNLVKNIEEVIYELDKAGIYFLYDNEELIYIGESNCLARRIFCNHRNGNSKNSTLIRRLLRGDLEGKLFQNESEVKEYIKSLKIEVLVYENADRKRIERLLKKVLKPKL